MLDFPYLDRHRFHCYFIFADRPSEIPAIFTSTEATHNKEHYLVFMSLWVFFLRQSDIIYYIYSSLSFVAANNTCFLTTCFIWLNPHLSSIQVPRRILLVLQLNRLLHFNESFSKCRTETNNILQY